MGPNAGLGSTDEATSEGMPVDGTWLRGEKTGDVSVIWVLTGPSSGDTEAEYVLPAYSGRTSGDVGEGGPGGMCWRMGDC